jgi:hypothetical protein
MTPQWTLTRRNTNHCLPRRRQCTGSIHSSKSVRTHKQTVEQFAQLRRRPWWTSTTRSDRLCGLPAGCCCHCSSARTSPRQYNDKTSYNMERCVQTPQDRGVNRRDGTQNSRPNKGHARANRLVKIEYEPQTRAVGRHLLRRIGVPQITSFSSSTCAAVQVARVRAIHPNPTCALVHGTGQLVTSNDETSRGCQRAGRCHQAS